jgi:aminodeoxyfutalosine synthase
LRGRKKSGNRASYIINRYINYSNYCILSCQFCSFARKKRDADGFQFTVEEIVQKAREALEARHHGTAHRRRTASVAAVQLLHGHAQGARVEFKGRPQGIPRLQLKCFTAIEILHLAWLAKKSVEQTLD